MQLILTQTDIETALIRYANDLITVKEGMTITVELKATRGADGATAIIDISPAAASTAGTASSTPAKTATAKAEPVKQTPAAKTPVEPKADAKPEVVADANAKDQAADLQITQAENVVNDNVKDVTPEDEPEPEVEQEEEPEQEAETPAAKPASLFAGLRKPKND